MGTDQLMARAAELLWTGGLAAVPLAALVWMFCRAGSLRPATRHMLWFAVLASFITPAIAAAVWRPHWFRSDRIMATAKDATAERGGTPAAPVAPARVAVPAAADLPRLVYANTALLRPDPAPGTMDGRGAISAPAGAGPVNAPTAPGTADSPVRSTAPVRDSSDPGPAPLREWLARVLAVRDAVADVPPIPASLWFGGAVLVVVLSVWRRCMGALWLREATPAGPHVQATVRQVGGALGLSRVPRAVFIDAAVSPMIWCGLRPVLVLPASLWRTLDEDSRRAVLVHELAHVRRFDHLICWLEAAVGALYWWHPVVWWVRRRLHEEAEASCDTWVTAIFPGDRRAYAAALVVTKSFVSTRAASRGPWLGVVSGSAKRLARRITMVMTHKAAPRMSMLGAIVTTLVIGVGAFVMPGLACPPEDDAAQATKARTKGQAPRSKLNTEVRVVAPTPPTPPSAPAPPAAPGAHGGVRFLGEAPALEAMRLRAPQPPAPPEPPAAPRPAKAPKARGGRAAVNAAPTPRVQVMDLDALREGREPREYRLSEGKLQAFYGMMSRGDVPILVQLGEDHITIWGTEDEHAVFAKFVRIVEGKGPDSRAREAELSATRAARLYESGAGLGQREEAARRAYDTVLREQGALERAQERAQRQRMEFDIAQEARAEAEAARAHEQVQREHARTLEQHLRTLERQVREMEARAKRLEAERARSKDASPGMVKEKDGECQSACEQDGSTN